MALDTQGPSRKIDLGALPQVASRPKDAAVLGSQKSTTMETGEPGVPTRCGQIPTKTQGFRWIYLSLVVASLFFYLCF